MNAAKIILILLLWAAIISVNTLHRQRTCLGPHEIDARIQQYFMEESP